MPPALEYPSSVHARIIEKLAQNHAVGSEYINAQNLQQGRLREYHTPLVYDALADLIGEGVVQRHNKQGNLKTDVISIIPTSKDAACRIVRDHLPEDDVERVVARIRNPERNVVSLSGGSPPVIENSDDDGDAGESSEEYVPRPLYREHRKELLNELERVHGVMHRLEQKVDALDDLVQQVNADDVSDIVSQVSKLEGVVESLENGVHGARQAIDEVESRVHDRVDHLEDELPPARVQETLTVHQETLKAIVNELDQDARERVAAAVNGCAYCGADNPELVPTLQPTDNPDTGSAVESISPTPICLDCQQDGLDVVVYVPRDVSSQSALKHVLYETGEKYPDAYIMIDVESKQQEAQITRLVDDYAAADDFVPGFTGEFTLLPPVDTGGGHDE